MKKVLLINRQFNGSHQQYPVSGRSGKFYGTAFHVPEKSGLVLEMSVEDYERDKFDIIGNPAAGHQWVPEFVSVPDDTRPAPESKPETFEGKTAEEWFRLHEVLRSDVARLSPFEQRLRGIFETLKGRYPEITTVENGLDAAAVERDAALNALRDLDHRVHSGYDFNADPDQITLLVGKILGESRQPAESKPALRPDNLAEFLDKRSMSILRSVAKDCGLKLLHPKRETLTNAILEAAKQPGGGE